MHEYGWNPTHCMADFELAAMRAFMETWPQCQTSGCLFHLGQAVLRRLIQLPNLYRLYKDNEEIRIQTKTLQALSFVPVRLIPRYFCMSMDRLNDMCHGNPEIRGRLFMLQIIKTKFISVIFLNWPGTFYPHGLARIFCMHLRI